jgi:hypothetical protein
MIKSPAQYRAGNWLQVTAHGGLAARPAGPADKLARPRPGGPVQPRLRLARALMRARGGVVAGLLTARQWLAGGEVHPESTSEAPG